MTKDAHNLYSYISDEAIDDKLYLNRVKMTKLLTLQ